ncbi:MAG: PIG-L family deacetylase [Candidatus Lokiarchaeota archaeon]|nr:PIG-L family deacetylase [Candidatus Lokiarchaeota archaeon]
MKNCEYILVEDDFKTILVPKRIMVLAGHPDDEIISCGGTLLKYQELGSEIIIVLGTYGLGGYSEISKKDKIKDIRDNELETISQVLNWKYINLGYENLDIDREKISSVTKLILKEKPHIILAPHFKDIHRIHRNFSYIIRESIYHCSLGNTYGLQNNLWIPFGFYYYETPSCKFKDIYASSFIIVDINNYLNQKIQILNNYYKSQKFLIDKISNWMINTASLRGSEINKKFGEAYIPDTIYSPLKLVLY